MSFPIFNFYNNLANTDVGLFKRAKNAIIDLFNFIRGRFKRTSSIDIGADAAIKLLNKELSKIEDLYESALDVTASKQGDGIRTAKNAPEKVMYSITHEDVKLIQSIGRKSINDLTKDELKKLEGVAEKYYTEMGVKSPFFMRWFGNWRAEEKRSIIKTILDTNKNLPGTYVKNEDTEFNIFAGSLLKSETQTHSKNKSNSWLRMLMVNNSEEILKNAILLDSNISTPNGNKSKSTIIMHSFYNICEYNGKLYLAEIYVEEFLNDGNVARRAYEAKEIKIKPIASSKSGNNSPSLQPVTIGSVKNISDLFNLVKTYDKDFKPKPTSLVLNEDGTPKVVYHQTENEFTVFDTKHGGAGTRDHETPFGIFMKSTPKNIGLKGEKQISLYANIQNPLTVLNRAELVRKVSEFSPEYSSLYEKHKILDMEYPKKFDKATEDLKNYLIEWRKSNPDASRTAIYDDIQFNEKYNAEDRLIEEWQEKAQELEIKIKNVLTKALRDKKYDGVYIAEDVGSFGRKTDAWIALDSNQVKSVDNGGTFSSWNDDIMLSKSPTTPKPSDIEPPDFESMADMALPSLKLKEEVQKKIDAYVAKYGEMEKGSMPARDVVVPKKTSEKTYVRRNTRTIAEAEAITDEKASVLLEEVANDESWTTYERFGDKQAIDSAVTEFERLGYDAALRRWRAIYESNKRITKQDIVDVHLLIQEAAKRNDTKTFIELVSNSAEIGTMVNLSFDKPINLFFQNDIVVLFSFIKI